MRRTWMCRGKLPRHPLVSAGAAAGRKKIKPSKTQAFDGLTGRQIAARSWAAPSEKTGRSRHGEHQAP